MDYLEYNLEDFSGNVLFQTPSEKYDYRGHMYARIDMRRCQSYPILDSAMRVCCARLTMESLELAYRQNKKRRLE